MSCYEFRARQARARLLACIMRTSFARTHACEPLRSSRIPCGKSRVSFVCVDTKEITFPPTTCAFRAGAMMYTFVQTSSGNLGQNCTLILPTQLRPCLGRPAHVDQMGQWGCRVSTKPRTALDNSETEICFTSLWVTCTIEDGIASASSGKYGGVCSIIKMRPFDRANHGVHELAWHWLFGSLEQRCFNVYRAFSWLTVWSRSLPLLLPFLPENEENSRLKFHHTILSENDSRNKAWVNM